MNAKTTKHVTEAVHAQDGEMHVVGVKALRVMLLADEGGFFAQGLEIDYAACGATIEEAKNNFESGLEKTVHEHLVMHGGITKLLKLAPQEAWDLFINAPKDSLKASFTTLQFHQVKKEAGFPFNKLEFVEPHYAMAA